MKFNVLISVILPLNHDKPIFESYLRSLGTLLSNSFSHYEIVIVDFSMNDKAWLRIERLLNEISCIRYIKLTRKVEFDVAIAAGLESAIGDFVVLTDSEKDPIDIILPAVEKCMKGKDIIIGVSDVKPNILYRIIRRIFRVFFQKSIGYNVPKGSTPFRVISRKVINSLLKSPDMHKFIFVKISQNGYESELVKYTPKSITANNRSIFEIIEKSINIIIFNSTQPLRIMTWLGLLGSLITLGLAIYILLINFIKKDVIEGWTTTNLFIALQFFLVFLVLSVLGEYLSKVLLVSQQIENYDIAFEKNSSVYIKDEQINVLASVEEISSKKEDIL